MIAATVGALLAIGVTPIANAAADPPLLEPGQLTVTRPANGSTTNEAAPVFTGTVQNVLDEVGVRVYESTVKGKGLELESVKAVPTEGGAWSTSPLAKALPDGTYIAQAELLGELGEPLGVGELLTFTVDTTPPQVTITSPANGAATIGGSEAVAGTAGTALGDNQVITVTLFSGIAAQPGPEIQSIVVGASHGVWSGTFGGLAPGTYTARAQQTDKAGNTGTSAPVTFTVTVPPPPPPHPPPTASFHWFPTEPQTGEGISLVSSSSDLVSPINGFAWALPSDGLFHPGGPLLTTTFSTPGAHVVRLRVTAADGLSSTVAQTIQVSSPPLALMLPFPIVRIAGRVTRGGANLSLLAAQAPIGSLVTVTCHGRGCPRAFEGRVAASRRKGVTTGSVLLAFRRFERSLRAGVVLEVRVAQLGEVGKYTRFQIRRNQLPARYDSCLGSLNLSPMACPS